jgi:hypothetical protein
MSYTMGERSGGGPFRESTEYVLGSSSPSRAEDKDALTPWRHASLSEETVIFIKFFYVSFY